MVVFRACCLIPAGKGGQPTSRTDDFKSELPPEGRISKFKGLLSENGSRKITVLLGEG